MIELKNNKLEISFPEVHKDAKTSIDFKRTLRIPNDGNTYPLPAGLGNFPLHHIEDFSETIPDNWKHHGGVMLPMYQSEALWINFSNRNYPIAIKIGTGKINAINGREWRAALNFRKQDYIVSSEQPWIDGFKIEEGIIRQFVAAPLRSGLTVEEQITGEAEFGGLQIEAFPLKAEAWENILMKRKLCCEERVDYFMAEPEMGFGMGGNMRQHIYADEHNPNDWDFLNSNRCFVHVLNSIYWKEVTGQNPPDLPLTKNDYELENIPWFEYYSEKSSVGGTNVFSKLDTIDSDAKNVLVKVKPIKKSSKLVTEWNTDLPTMKKYFKNFEDCLAAAKELSQVEGFRSQTIRKINNGFELEFAQNKIDQTKSQSNEIKGNQQDPNPQGSNNFTFKLDNGELFDVLDYYCNKDKGSKIEICKKLSAREDNLLCSKMEEIRKFLNEGKNPLFIKEPLGSRKDFEAGRHSYP